MSAEYPDLKPPAEPGWSGDYLDTIVEAQRQMDELDTTQMKASVRIAEALPFGVVYSGDWHIGGRGTDHSLLKEYVDLWRRVPGLGVIGMGDYTEMFTGKMAKIGVNEHVIPPDMQIASFCDFAMTELVGKMLVLLKGNHDAWAGSNLSNYVQLLAQRMSIPYLGVGGELHLTIGNMTYRNALWHRYPGGSALNKGNNQRRVSIDHNGPDVIALAHLHYQYGELTRSGEVDQVRLRSGALKVTDEHARDAAGNVIADTRMPMIIFSPNERKMLYWPDFRDGIEHLVWARRRWAEHPGFGVDKKRLEAILTP